MLHSLIPQKMILLPLPTQVLCLTAVLFWGAATDVRRGLTILPRPSSRCLLCTCPYLPGPVSMVSLIHLSWVVLIHVIWPYWPSRSWGPLLWVSGGLACALPTLSPSSPSLPAQPEAGIQLIWGLGPSHVAFISGCL